MVTGSAAPDTLTTMPPVFTDPAAAPDEAAIAAALGPAASAWHTVTALLSATGAEPAWRYYRDGGWLTKASRGSRTIAWLSIEPGLVRFAAYFAERHRAELTALPELDAALRGRLMTEPLLGRLLPVALELRSDEDARRAGAVAELRARLR